MCANVDISRFLSVVDRGIKFRSYGWVAAEFYCAIRLAEGDLTGK
jgi:hypothetical protein